MNKLILNIKSNEGYSEEDIKYAMTVGELKDILENWDDDIEIVTCDINNRYGASYGKIIN
jgi:hypothetical protein